MSKPATLDVIAALVAEHLGCPEAAARVPTTTLAELGADDLDEVEIVLACEEVFAVEIDEFAVKRFKTTMADLVRLCGGEGA